jgi:hypothetical protein
MPRSSPIKQIAVVTGLVAALWIAPAAALNFGDNCIPGTSGPTGSGGGKAGDDTGNNWYCNGNSNTVTFPAYWFGNTTSGCGTGTAGLTQFTGTAVSPNNTFEFCNGTSWLTLGATTTSLALSGITAAIGTASINSGANAITWAWNSLGSGVTGMTFSTSSALTGGSALLSLQATAASATSTGYVLSISDSTTGTGYGVYSAMTATANTGYAGYFLNSTGTGAGYGLYVTTSTTGSGYGIYASITGTNNPGYAGYFTTASSFGGAALTGYNSNTGGGVGVYGQGANYGVNGAGGSGSGGIGVYGTNANNGTGNYGVEGNASGTGAVVGVYGTAASSSGYGGYFTNTSTGWALAATGTSYFNGNVGIGTATPTHDLSFGGSAAREMWMERTTSGAGNNLTLQAGGAVSGGSNSAGGNLVLSSGISTGSGTSQIQFNVPNGQAGSTSDNAPAAAMNIGWNAYHGAEVSIGTTTLSDSLSVVGNESGSGNGHILVQNTSTGTGAWSGVQILNYSGNNTFTLGFTSTGWNTYSGVPANSAYIDSNGNALEIVAESTSGTNGIRFLTGGNASSNEAMRITATGTVGIGTTSPAGQLDVESTTTYAGYFNNTATATSVDGVYAATASTTTGAAVYAQITGTANTGYGGYFSNTSAAGYGLYVNGLAAVTSSLQVGATSASCGTGNAGAVQYTGGLLEFCNGSSWEKISFGPGPGVLISTQTASSSASLQFTTTANTFSSSYNTLFINCWGLLLSAANHTIYMYVGEGSGPTWKTAATYTSPNGAGQTDLLGLGNFNLNTATDPLDFDTYIYNVSSTTLHKVFLLNEYLYTAANQAYGSIPAFWAGDTAALTGVELVPSAGTIASGTCSLYGMN